MAQALPWTLAGWWRTNMALLEPTALKLKTRLLSVTQILGSEARLQELDQIASALLAAYNETDLALSSKIGGLGHRSFGGKATVTGATNRGDLTITFTHSVPSASYAVFLAPFGGTEINKDFFGYSNRSTSGFDIDVTTMTNGQTIDFFWFVVY